MALFLVNKLSEDGLIGEVTQVDVILHNLMIIGPLYHEGFLKYLENCSGAFGVQICICGRFVAYIEVKRDMKEGFMKLFDLRNDNDLALDAAATIQERWYSSDYFTWFMEEFEKMKEVYQVNYTAAEMSLVKEAGYFLN